LANIHGSQVHAAASCGSSSIGVAARISISQRISWQQRISLIGQPAIIILSAYQHQHLAAAASSGSWRYQYRWQHVSWLSEKLAISASAAGG